MVSIATAYPNWDAIAKGGDAEAVAGLGDEAYFTGSGQVLFVKKGSVVISTSVADMIVKDAGQGDFDISPDIGPSEGDRARAAGPGQAALTDRGPRSATCPRCGGPS